MRIVAVSDTHGLCPVLPDGDVLILAGDVFVGDDEASLRKTLAWIKALPFAWKLFVPGNHDLIWRQLTHTQPERAKALLQDAGVTTLENDSLDISGLHIHGLGWRTSVAIPVGCDVLITHEPPRGVLDNDQGSEDLRKAITKAQPKNVVCGHIHEVGGRAARVGGTLYFNAAAKAIVFNV